VVQKEVPEGQQIDRSMSAIAWFSTPGNNTAKIILQVPLPPGFCVSNPLFQSRFQRSRSD
jgi:hypothetical protein